MAGGKKRGQVEALIRLVGEDGVTKLIEDTQKRLTGLDKQTKQTGKSTDDMGVSWGKVTMGIAAAGAAVGAVVLAAKAANDAILSAAQDDAIARGFNRQFAHPQQFLMELREASAGLADDQSLLKFGALAKRAELDMKTTSRLFELTAKAATDTGMEFTESLEQVLEGVIGRSSGFFEDRLGMAVDFGRDVSEANAKLKDLGVELTTQEEIALATEVAIREMGKQFDNVKTAGAVGQVQALNTQLANLQRDAKQAAADVATTFLRLGGAVKTNADVMNSNFDATKKVFDGIKDLSRVTTDYDDHLQSLTVMMEDSAGVTMSLKGLIQKEAESRVTLADALGDEEEWRRLVDIEVVKLTAHTGLLSREIKIEDQAHASLTKRLWAEVKARQELAGSFDSIDKPIDVGLLGKPKRPRGGRRAARLAAAAQKRSEETRREMAALFAQGPGDHERLAAKQAQVDATLNQAEAQGKLNDAEVRLIETQIQLGDSFEGMFTGTGGIEGFASEMLTMVDAVDEFTKAGRSAGDAWKKAAPGMVAASAKVAAGFIDDQRIQAIVMAAIETAHSIASFASGNIKGGVMHAAAAVAFGVAAAKAGGSAGAGAGGGAARGTPQSQRNTLQGAQPPPGQGGGTNNIVINMRGAMLHGGNQQQFIRTLGKNLEDETRRRSAVNPEFAHG